jgi:ESX secretion-associated protein EspG
VQTGRSTVELSVYPLISLIHKENLGDPHPILAGGELYMSHRFVSESERWLRGELAEAGLADRSQLADFTGMLSIIQAARTEFYGWVTTQDDSYSVLAAAHGRNAFVLIRRGEYVSFRRVSPERLAEALVDQLPDVPAGQGESISVAAAELGSTSGTVLRGASGTTRSEPARRLIALFRTPRRGVAKLYSARRDDAGNRVRSREWLDLFDVSEGRWAVHTTAGRGERIINAVAAPPTLIAAKLTELLRTAR